MRQVLFNLISNALKFTEKGEIRVRVSSKSATDDDVILRFEVEDTGIGIPDNKAAILFEKFTQADGSTTRRFGGAGLGLAISRQLVNMMGGDIGVGTNIEGGSIFFFTINCSLGDSALFLANKNLRPIEDVTGSATLKTRPKFLRILVAEDNSINQLLIKTMLEKAGHQVDLVTNGLQALDAVIRTDFDLVLMDMNTPEMDGLTATQRIRGLPVPKSHQPIIALTANAMKGDREKLIEVGMDDYVSKPIDTAELAQAIERQCKTTVALTGLVSEDDSLDDLTREQKDAVGGLNSELDRLIG